MSDTPTIKGYTPATVNIEWKRGTTLSFYQKFFQDEAKTVPLDISGSTFKMDVVNPKTGKIILQFATGGSGLTIQNTNELHFAKTKDQMKVAPGIYEYDLDKIDGAVVATIQDGEFTIFEERTK